MCSAKLSKNVIHPLESSEYNFVNEELLKICFEKRDPIKPVRQIIANFFFETTKIDFLKHTSRDRSHQMLISLKTTNIDFFKALLVVDKSHQMLIS